MKTRIEEMTESEVLALTDDQIKWLVRYAMAEQGVKDLPEPIKPEPFVPEYDEQVFEVNGMYFADHDIAEIVRCCLTDHAGNMRKLDYNWQKSSKYKYVQENCEFSFYVQKVKAFSAAKYQTLSGEMLNHEKALSEYEKQLKEYKSEMEKSDAIKQSIYDTIAEHRSAKYQRDRSCENYKGYLELASGNQETARKFFEKTYPGANHQEIYDLVDGVVE